MKNETKLEIYGSYRSRIYQEELKLLHKAEISPRNKELIRMFHNSLFAMNRRI